jgi:hypothetical protein
VLLSPETRKNAKVSIFIISDKTHKRGQVLEDLIRSDKNYTFVFFFDLPIDDRPSGHTAWLVTIILVLHFWPFSVCLQLSPSRLKDDVTEQV